MNARVNMRATTTMAAKVTLTIAAATSTAPVDRGLGLAMSVLASLCNRLDC